MNLLCRVVVKERGFYWKGMNKGNGRKEKEGKGVVEVGRES